MNLALAILKLLLGISLMVLVFVAGPILTIWALNTLFPVLAIPYTMETWAAAFLLMTPFSFGTVKGRFKKND